MREVYIAEKLTVCKSGAGHVREVCGRSEKCSWYDVRI